MGKKRDDMRKRRGAAGRRQARVVVGGVRTRAVTARRAAARRKAVASASVEEGSLVGRGGGCYLRLRSRRVYFMAAAVVSREQLRPVEEVRSSRAVELLGDSVEDAMVGTGTVSRSASAASSAERTQRGSGAAQAGEDRDEESSVGDSGCHRQRRETTPSSRPPGDSSDAESNQESEEQKHRHRGRSSTTSAVAFHSPARTRSIRMPLAAAAEIEEFLAAAERAEAERFAAKYNFDVVRGVPLDGAGRFEWTAVGSG